MNAGSRASWNGGCYSDLKEVVGSPGKSASLAGLGDRADSDSEQLAKDDMYVAGCCVPPSTDRQLSE